MTNVWILQRKKKTMTRLLRFELDKPVERQSLGKIKRLETAKRRISIKISDLKRGGKKNVK